jgi:hypothetical protein
VQFTLLVQCAVRGWHNLFTFSSNWNTSMHASPTPTPTPMDRIDAFWHEGMLTHDSGSGVFDSGMDPGFLDVLEKHPENADRVKNMLSILKRGPISPYISWHCGRPARIPELLSFHTQGTRVILCLLTVTVQSLSVALFFFLFDFLKLV